MDVYKSAGYPGQGVSGASPAVDPSSSQIRDAISNNEQAVIELHEAISRMEQRLDTVLTPTPPQTANTIKTPAGPNGSHVLGRLAILNEGCADAAQRLRDLIRRVEV